MKKIFEKIINSTQKKEKKVLYSSITMLAIMVVFVTAYMLIAPGVTAEKITDGNLKLHNHTKECYNEREELTCGYADFVVHIHDEHCYNKDGILICPLKEQREHIHDSSCFQEQKELICTQNEQESHYHQPSCYEKRKGDLQCDLEQHTHVATCFDEGGNLVCQKKEHTHTDDCYLWNDVLICDKEESDGHTHTEACYEMKKALVCKKPEIMLHTHVDQCYDHGNLICNKLEIKKHQHTESCFIHEKDIAGDKNKADVVHQTPPIDLEQEKLIKSFKLSYKDTKNNTWVEIKSETKDIPGDATVLLQVEYQNVDINKLKNAGLKVTYQLPALLKDPEVNGDLKADGKNIGTIKTEGKKVVLTFFEEWIQQQENKEMHEINGEFYVESQFDGSQIEGDGPGKIVIGGVEVTINFEKDVAAKHGRVTVVKNKPTLEEKKDGLYLKYSLEVQVPNGAADVPDVKVLDHFKNNKQYVESYVGVDGSKKETKEESSSLESGPIEKIQAGKTRGRVYLGNETSDGSIPEPAGESLVKPGMLVWEIGKMTAGETRTLTYEVKLKDHYKPANVNSNYQNITNEASVYSKTYFRGNSEQHYTPNISVDIVKTVGEFVPNEHSDGGKLSYQVQVRAEQSNSYTVHNVKVEDSIATEKFAPYLEYEKSSFKLYKGKNTSGEAISLESVKPDGKEDNPIIKTETDSKKSFELYVGDLKPGEEKTITYTILVKEGIWTVDNGEIRVGNTVGAYSDDSKEGGNKKYKDSHVDKMLGEKAWSRKITGEFIKQEKTITIPNSDKVYIKQGNSYEEEKPNPGSFKVPAFSQEYQILVNEEGKWDFSKAEFKDTLKHQQMVHTGYLKLEAYQIGKTSEKIISDSDAIANVKKGTLQQTVWVKIDQQKEFAFTPENLKVSGKYAYLMTYYSSLKNPEEQYQIHIGNQFQLSGAVVGPQGSHVTIPGITVDKEVDVQGENHYSAEKIAWYYEKPSAHPQKGWENGGLYWVIKVNGNQIPKFLKIKDTISSDAHQMIPEESLVGIYQGSIPKGKTLLDYKTIAEFESIDGMKKLEGIYSDKENTSKDYRWEVRKEGTYHYLFAEFSNAIPLSEVDEEAIYTIIKTAPTKLPEGKRDSIVYSNKFETSNRIYDQWKAGNEATLTVRKSQQIFKETQGAFTFDGTTWKTLKAGKHNNADNLAKELIQEPGTYIEWLVHLNWDGSMEGLAEIEDQLPKGVELTYVRYYWLASHYKENGQTSPETPEIPELQENQDWEKRITTYKPQETPSGTKTCISYYNPKTKKIRWNVTPLQIGGKKIDDRGVEFQVVCKVTDKDALLSGKDVTKNNSIEVTYKGNKLSDSDQISFKKQTLSKTGVYDSNNAGNYPFEIELNPLGEDLVVGSDHVTLVDELSNTLTIAPETIQIVNQKTQENVTALCTVTIDKTEDKQILRITVPDSMHLKIAYTTFVNAKPGETIAISNIAHWEGYGVADGGSVIDPSFSYTAGGSAGGDAKPSLKVIKLDKEDLTQKLQGAMFSVQKIRKQSDGTWKPEGKKYQATTDRDGVAMFSYGTQSERWMEYDTIYCLKEEQAPSGYVQDKNPYYFAIMKDKTLEEIGDGFEEVIHPWYQSSQYVYSAYNHKGEIQIEKYFKKADETPLKHPPKGSYQFGLFKEEAANTKPLQILTITYDNDTVTYYRDGKEVTEPTFINLEVNEEAIYYIYELDSHGKPVKNNQLATINGKTFEVTYKGNGSTLSQSIDGKHVIQIINTNKQFILPETGGKGSDTYLITGLILVIFALGGYFYRQQKIRRTKD